jgi:hypothetical protein
MWLYRFAGAWCGAVAQTLVSVKRIERVLEPPFGSAKTGQSATLTIREADSTSFHTDTLSRLRHLYSAEESLCERQFGGVRMPLPELAWNRGASPLLLAGVRLWRRRSTRWKRVSA